MQPAGAGRVLASGLVTPWSIVRLANGSTLISERDTGMVRQLTPHGTLLDGFSVSGVRHGGEGGLLGIAVDPSSEDRLYLYITTEKDNRVVRAVLRADDGVMSIGTLETVIAGIPRSGNHNGGRIAFGPDGALYITAGDAGEPDRAQDPNSLGGKILRVNADGSIPADNPFGASPVWSMGHRNPQGIAWDDDGQLFAAEFGQNTWDEFNRIEVGGNYGWPIVEGTGNGAGDGNGNGKFIDPLYQWPTSEASPSGLLFSQGTFFLAALRGERVWALYVDGDTVNAVPWFEHELGRIRHVAEGPNGSLWVLTSNTDGNGDQRPGADRLLEYQLTGLRKG
ncbi:MAG: PQQ-dependent sugar dehydrogenase [Microbacteriaceae bacterium]